MRRPVDVNSYCGWVSSYPLFSFARISGDLWLARAAVKTERSEFILSLDGRRRQPYRGFPGEGKYGYSLCPICLSHIRVELSCRHPSIRTRCERLMRSVHIGCSRYSRRCLLKAPSRAIRRRIGGKGKGAVAGTRHLRVVHPRLLPELCRYRSTLSG